MSCCPICSQDYNYQENIPLILSLCGHTVCVTCVDHIINSTADGKFRCPFDKKEFPYPVIRSDSFPRNYELLRVIDDCKEIQKNLELEQKKVQELTEKVQNIQDCHSDPEIPANKPDDEISMAEQGSTKVMEELAKLKLENEDLSNQNVKLEDMHKDLQIEIKALKKIIEDNNENHKILQRELETERALKKNLADESKLYQEEAHTLRNLYNDQVVENSHLKEKLQKLEKPEMKEISQFQMLPDDLPSKMILDPVDENRQLYRGSISNPRDPILLEQRRREFDRFVDPLRRRRESDGMIITSSGKREAVEQVNNLLNKAKVLDLLQPRNPLSPNHFADKFTSPITSPILEPSADRSLGPRSPFMLASGQILQPLVIKSVKPRKETC